MIPIRETLEIEFKSDKTRLPDHDLVETVVGFANTHGGILYLGVEDDGTVSGIHPEHRDHQGIVPLIANKTIPSVSVRTELLQILDKEVVCIHVPRSSSIVSTTNGKYLRRALKLDGTPETVPLYPFQIPNRLADLGRLDFSAEPARNSSLEDLDPLERDRMRRLIQTSHGDDSLLELSDEELDLALHLTTELEGQTLPTIAGLLLLCKAERLKVLLPTATSAFQVLEGTRVQINEFFCRPLLATLEQVESYLRPWNPERELEYGLLRIAIPEFDPRAFREAVVNAFVHRDYTVLQDTRILIDDDGLTISNPGGFVEGVTQRNLLTVEPHGRNPTLSDAFKRIGLAERTGRGVDRIFAGSILQGRPLPDYSESTDQTVRVLIPRAAPDMAFIRMMADIRNRDGRDLPTASLMVLSVLRSDRRCSLHQLTERAFLNETRCKSTVERLVESGMVEGHGNGRGRVYMLSSKIYREERRSADYIRQRGIDSVKHPEMILALVEKQGHITRDDVMHLAGLNPSQAYQILKKLTDQGHLELQNRGRGARYIRKA